MNFTLFITVLLTAVTLVVAAYVIAKLIGPRSYNPVKGEPFECGIPTRGSSWLPSHIGYYRALLYSHNNVSYHKALGDNHTLQACAFNTDNAINNIKVIKERVENVFQGRRANATLVHIKMANDMLVAGDKISKLSVRLGWLGAILGVLSLLLGIISIL